VNWKEQSVSQCQTFHVLPDNTPAYSNRFDNVLAFHAPGMAPVSADTMAWHIKPDGTAAYAHRFHRTFGFYGDCAAVVDASGWFHIHPNGQATYTERYIWAGNFQSNRCSVCDLEGNYFHIDLNGNRLNQNTWGYCGDYREGTAVVQNHQGLSSHIDLQGNLTHGIWFDDLDVFHKGYARANSDGSWFHINQYGAPIYPQRYYLIEPFYNGLARVESANGERTVIDEGGRIIRILKKSKITGTAALSSQLVGFWKTIAIGTAVELGIPELLPSTTATIAKKLTLNTERLARLLNALAELEIIKKQDDTWLLTDKSQQLSKQHPLTLADAALEYKGDMLQRWLQLPAIIRGQEVNQDIFHEVTVSSERLIAHHRMLNSYAVAEYPHVVDQLELKDGIRLFDAAGGTGATANLLQQKFPNAEITLGELPEVLSITTDNPQIKKHSFNLHQSWNIETDAIILAKVIHDWNDTQAVIILQNAYASLSHQGTVTLLEMLTSDNNYSGALCDLHLLTVTGGQERSFSRYEYLLESSGFINIRLSNPGGLISIITAEKSLSA